MIVVYGTDLAQLPCKSELSRLLRSDWYEAWLQRHPNLQNENAARASLGGLLLLEHSGASGRLLYDPEGRPFLEEKTVDFNVTHTDCAVFCAVELLDGTSKSAPRVGLDAESLRRLPSDRLLALARRWFAASELDALLLDPTELSFLRIWTRKEALVKFTGKGLRAMRGLDSTQAERDFGVCFCEYRVGDTFVTLCHRASETPPREVEMLSARELQTSKKPTTC